MALVPAHGPDGLMVSPPVALVGQIVLQRRKACLMSVSSIKWTQSNVWAQTGFLTRVVTVLQLKEAIPFNRLPT